MEKDAKIYVAGHRGMVGSAIVRQLEKEGYTNIITRTHKELDLCRQDAVEEFFAKEKPDYVFLAAINPGENQENVAWFLGKHPEFELLDMEQIYPGTQVGDGFFYARLRRIS